MLPANFRALYINPGRKIAGLILDNQFRDYWILPDGSIDFASEEIHPINPADTVKEIMGDFAADHDEIVMLDEKEAEEFFVGLAKSKL